MSIRHGLLALLSRGPRHGYQLRTEFEASTGTSWPLNIGQVYSTLARLERDELVTRAGADDEGRFVYRITPAGEADARRWFATPLARADRPRDELAIKLAMAVTAPGVDVRDVVRTQRAATLRALRDLDRMKAAVPAAATAGPSRPSRPSRPGLPDRSDRPERPDGRRDPRAWPLVLDSMIFQTEAELRWLDHCEKSLTGPSAS